MLLTLHVSTDTALGGCSTSNDESCGPLLMFLGWWQPAYPCTAQGQAFPDSSEPLQAEPSGHIRPDRCQLPRCSTGANRVTSEGYWRQEQLCSDTMFTPRWTHQSWPANPSGLMSVCCLSPWQHPLPTPLATNITHHKRRHVCTGHGSSPLSKQGHKNNYKKINTGKRCHLVSRPANTPPGNVPVPPVH